MACTMPAGAHCTGNPQVCDDNGLDFRFDSPPLLMAEGSYKYNQEGHLPGTIKIGGWNPRTHRNSLAFNLMVTVSLAVTGSPLGTGEAPLRGRGFSTGAYFPGNDGLIILVYSSGPIVRRVKCPKT